MDMMSLLTDFDHTKIDSRYRLVLIAAQRARQFMQGSKPMITSRFTKEATIALDEVLQGKTEFLTGKEAKAAMKEAVLIKASEDKAKLRALAALPRDDESEIKKDLNIYINDRKEDEASVGKSED